MKKRVILLLLICMLCSINIVSIQVNSNGSTDFRKYKVVSINSSQLTEDITDFPLLISVIDPDLSNCQEDGDDITFWNSEFTNQYNHELEYFNKSTGELIAWVQLPYASSTSNTTFRLYYDNPDVNTSENSEPIWSAFEAVYHLTLLNDSAKNNTLAKYGSVIENLSGIFGYAQEFDGYGNDYLMTNTNFNITTSFTVSCWIKIEATDVDQTFITIPHSLTGVAQRLMVNWTGNNAVARNYNISALGVNTGSISAINDGEWHYLVHSYDNDTNKLYLDGVLEGSSPHTGIVRCEYNKSFIGREGDYTFSNWQETVMDGLIDEVRISRTPLSPEQIALEWKNYNNPSEFYQISEEKIILITTTPTTTTTTATTATITTTTTTTPTTTTTTTASTTPQKTSYGFLMILPAILLMRRKRNKSGD